MTFASTAFKNPFADYDFTKIAGEFKLPVVNVEACDDTSAVV